MSSMDDLGDRMKAYEARETSHSALPYAPVYARIDGKGFSKFTRSMERPYDKRLSEIMVETTKRLVQATNARIGYTQSDEISLVWKTDTPREQLMFDGKFQKMCSVFASMATAYFTARAIVEWPELVAKLPPMFDCRVFSLPNETEAANAFLWREVDATKNAISMAASHYYSHRELQYKSGSQMQEMLFQKGINFNDYPDFFKRGSFIRREQSITTLEAEDLQQIPEKMRPEDGKIIRHVYERLDMPSFRKVINRTGVIFHREHPMTASEEN